MTGVEKEIGEFAEPCVVCAVSLQDVASPLHKELMREIIGLCSTKCQVEFHKDPEKFLEAVEEEEAED